MVLIRLLAGRFIDEGGNWMSFVNEIEDANEMIMMRMMMIRCVEFKSSPGGGGNVDDDDGLIHRFTIKYASGSGSIRRR